MQYNHRNRLPPPPPFGRGGGGAGYPRGLKQVYYAPPPPLPPERKYQVLMEAGRLAAEYLVTQGVLPPAALQRGAGAWASPLPPPPAQEPPAFYGRRRYEDEYSNNPSTRPRRTNGTSSTTSNRDDYSSGSYNGRGKRKYGEYRRGYSESSRDRWKERGRGFSNGRRYEDDEDEDGAAGFRRERRGYRGTDEMRSNGTEAVSEEMPVTAKAVGELDAVDAGLKAVTSICDVTKDADDQPAIQSESEEGEMGDESKMLNSEPEVVAQGIDTVVNTASTGVIESEPKPLPDGKVPDEVPGEKAEEGRKNLDEIALDHNTFDVEATKVESNICDDKADLCNYCDFTRAPTRPRSVRPHRNAASVPGETSVAEKFNLVSSGQTSQMVSDEYANECSLANTQSEIIEDQICQENSSVVHDEAMEPMLHQENGTSIVTENIREDNGDVQLHAVQEYKGETNLSPLVVAHKDNMMQETSLSPLKACCKDSLMQETDISPLTASNKDSMIEETELSPLTAPHKDSLMQETDVSRTMSSHENTLKLQFNEGTQICDIDTVSQDVNSTELSDQRKIVGAEVCPNVGSQAVIEIEERNMDQSSSLKITDLDLVGGAEVSAIHDNPALARLSADGSSAGPHEKQQEDPVIAAGSNASATDDLCQFPLQNNDVQVTDIECDTPIEVGGFDSSKSKNEIICSSMDSLMPPGIHADILPGVQDGYNIAFSDFLGADIPCYPSMQSDLHAGIGANDSEGITIMDDPIYGSLTDIGFLDVWGQPAQDYDKFF